MRKNPEDQNAFCHLPRLISGTVVLDGTQLLESAKRGGTRWAWQRIEGASGLGTGERGQALGGDAVTCQLDRFRSHPRPDQLFLVAKQPLAQHPSCASTNRRYRHSALVRKLN